MAQMEFGRRWGTPRRTMLTANILMLAMVTAIGLVVGVALLPWSSSDGVSRYWWTPLVLLPLLVALRPRTLPAVVDKTLSLFDREPLSVRPTGRSMVVATLWGFVVWVLTGLHLLVMTHALGADGVEAVAAAIGGMGLAWAAVLVATFAPQIGTAPALAVALASRVLLILGDVSLSGVGALIRSRRAGSTSGRGRATSE